MKEWPACQTLYHLPPDMNAAIWAMSVAGAFALLLLPLSFICGCRRRCVYMLARRA